MKKAANLFWTCALLAALAGRVAACVQSFPEWKRGRNFTVTMVMDGKPVQGMRVLLVPVDERKKSVRLETTSDDKGVARFIDVKPGRYYVEAHRLGVEVGPGTVVVSRQGSSDEIAVEWPVRPVFTVISVTGRLQRHIYRNANWVDGFVHPKVGPLAGAKLTLSRVDSEKQVGVAVTGSDGNFDFHHVEPGAYLLHIEEKVSPEFWQPIDDYLLVYVDPASVRRELRLQVDWTSCGIVASEIR